jgi:type I restriction enzyme S subunit
LTKRCYPEKGDLLLSKNGTIGVPCVVTWDQEFSIFVSLCLIKLRANLRPKYAKYFFLSTQIGEQITFGGKTNTITNLHLDKIKEFVFAAPPVQEQESIVAYLDQETAKINALIAKTQETIKKLKEYRTALISAAVTGKIDVRETISTNGGDDGETS